MTFGPVRSSASLDVMSAATSAVPCRDVLKHGEGLRWLQVVPPGRVIPVARAAVALLALSLSPAIASEPVSAQSTPGPTPRSLREVVRISGAEADLSVVALVAAGPQGDIWVSQPQDGNIAHFSAQGEILGRVGRGGEGPGEFRSVVALRATESTLRVFDRDLRRVTVLDHAGRVVGTTPLEYPADIQVLMVVAVGSDGYAFVRERAQARGEPTRIYRTRLDGTDPRLISVDAYPRCSHGTVSERRIVSVTIPLCAEAFQSFSTTGGFRAFASPLLAEGSRTGLSLVVTTGTGDTLSVSRHMLGASPIPRHVRDSVSAALVAREQRGYTAVAEEIVSRGLIPGTWPPIVRVAISDNGITWVTTRQGRDGQFALLVFNQQGQLVARAPLEPNQEVRWAGDRRVLVVEADSDGVQDVVLYERVGP